MDIKSRLKLLQRDGNSADNSPSDIRTRLDSLIKPRYVFNKFKKYDIDEIVDGKKVITEYGEVFVAESITNIFYDELDEKMTTSFQRFINKEDDENIYKLNETVFVDTETTGLSGGAGNYAFMIGIGFFDNNRLIVRQYFLEEFTFERAMLRLFQGLLRDHQHLVTFNGKCYDVPLLHNRFILCNMETKLYEMVHTDLLYPARALWKDKIGSVAFSSLEREILNKRRTDDIPGSMIPSAYFEYQRYGKNNLIKRIFNHNLEDIIGLFELYKELSKRFHDPQNHVNTRFSVAKYLYSRNLESSFPLLKLTIRDSDKKADVFQAMQLLSKYYKKSGDYERAAIIWKEMIKLFPDAEIYHFIELAKYYEHVKKDFLKAQDIITSLSLHFPINEKIHHRLRRIKRKLSKSVNHNSNYS